MHCSICLPLSFSFIIISSCFYAFSVLYPIEMFFYYIKKIAISLSSPSKISSTLLFTQLSATYDLPGKCKL